MFAVLIWAWSIVKSVLNMIAKAVVLVILVVVGLGVVGAFAGDGLPDKMVLELDLREAMPDKAPPAFLGIGGGLSVMDVVMGLDAAERDARVAGLFVRAGTADMPLAAAEELRDAFKRFKAAGKFIIAHSQGFYSSGLGDYAAVAGADEIWMQPVSTFFPSGASTSTLFFKGLFDKIAATPQFVQRYEYKNAVNVFTESDYTPAHREATMRLLQSWYDTATAGIAGDREIARDRLAAFLDTSPATADEAMSAGLVTSIGYDDDARDAAKARAGEDTDVTGFARFYRVKRANMRPASGPVVAFVHAAGDIVEGGGDALPDDNRIVGDDFAEAIREATDESDVKAILLRIDSPGGSAIASDQIYQALKKAKAAGKPVVVSMGPLAASGGYYIAASADRIVAHGGTLTGSIGVLWGKFAIGETLALAGVAGRELSVGEDALFLSGLTPWTDAQLAEVNQQADMVYADFTSKVAEGRNLSPERVAEVARGRVWTGADARERGLVDEIGGFWAAVAAVRSLTGIEEDARIVFRDYPARRGVLGVLSQVLGASAAGFQAMQGFNVLMEAAPVRALLAASNELPDGRAELRAVGLPSQ